MTLHTNERQAYGKRHKTGRPCGPRCVDLAGVPQIDDSIAELIARGFEPNEDQERAAAKRIREAAEEIKRRALYE